MGSSDLDTDTLVTGQARGNRCYGALLKSLRPKKMELMCLLT